MSKKMSSRTVSCVLDKNIYRTVSILNTPKGSLYFHVAQKLPRHTIFGNFCVFRGVFATVNKSYHFQTQMRSLVEGAKNNLQVCILNTVRYVYIHTYKAGVFFLFSSNYRHRARKFKDRNFTQPAKYLSI